MAGKWGGSLKPNPCCGSLCSATPHTVFKVRPLGHDSRGRGRGGRGRQENHTHVRDGEAEAHTAREELGALPSSTKALSGSAVAPTFPDLPALCSLSTEVPCFQAH